MAKIAKQCATVESKYFKGLDSKTGILSKLFVCTRIDITEVMPRDNPYINATKAPLVLLVSADGEKEIKLSSKKITKSILLSAMTSILKANGCGVSKILQQTKTLLSQIKNLEDRKGSKLRTVISAEKKLANARKKGSLAKVKEAESRKKAAEARLEGEEEKLTSLYSELDKMVQDSKTKIADSLGSGTALPL